MGNLESLGRGAVQFTSAGTGISHSEFNDSQKELVHFIQMWVKPNISGLKPSYTTKIWLDRRRATLMLKRVDAPEPRRMPEYERLSRE